MCNFGAVKREAFKAQVLEAVGPPDLSLRAEQLLPQDLSEMAALRVDIGNHTTNHVHCRSLSPEEMEHEIVLAKAQLEAMSGVPVRSFSIPYGHEADLTAETLKVVRESGHEAIFLVHSRSNMIRPAPDIWYRTSLHNERPGQLPRVLKHLPLIRTVKHRLLG
jgi:peptidoglycan/xylan/chitin deacetylase (PgdA/CDA1 family)